MTFGTLPELYANEAYNTADASYTCTATGAITSGATSFAVSAVTRLPTRPRFRIRVAGSLTGGGTGIEYMMVTGISGTTLTVQRAVEKPFDTALGFAAGAKVDHVLTAEGILSVKFIDARAYLDPDDSVEIPTATLQQIFNDGNGGTIYFPHRRYLMAVGDSAYPISPCRIIGDTAHPFGPLVGGTYFEAQAGQEEPLWLEYHLNDPLDYWAHGLIIEGIAFRGPPGLALPVAGSTSTATTGGTLAAGTYGYRVTALTAFGETRPSAEMRVTTTGATSTATINWTAPPSLDERAAPAITGYKVYGRTMGAWLLIATLGVVLTYTDTGSVTPAGAMNRRNTSGGQLGEAIRLCMGENAVIDTCSFTTFSWAGLRFRRDMTSRLTAAITNTTSPVTFTVASNANARDGLNAQIGDVLEIQSERLIVTGVSGTSITATRAAWGTTAATHPNNAKVWNQKICDSAPAVVRNLNSYKNGFAGMHCDHANGPHTVETWTGDDDAYQLAITNNTTDPNIAGNGLQVIVMGAKAEVSSNYGGFVGHNPWLYMNNPNECVVEVIGGRVTDFNAVDVRYPKAVVEITNGFNGFASTYSGIVTFRSHEVGNYQHLLVDRIKGEVIPWYVADDFPDFRRIGEFTYRGVVHFRGDSSIDPLKIPRIRGPKRPTMALTQTPAAFLSAVMPAAATQMTVNATLTSLNFPTAFPFVVRIDRENVRVDSLASGSTYNVTRNQTGSAAGAEDHVALSPVTYETDVYLMAGQGAPEAIVTAAPGSLYMELLSGANAPTAWAKDFGTGNTGWKALDGWEFLGATQTASALVSTGAITIPARHLLLVAYRITSMSTSDVPALRFNADSGANYWDRIITSIAGGVVLVNNQNVSQAFMRVGAPAGTPGSSGLVFISNLATSSKVATIMNNAATGAAGTAGSLGVAGGGEWVNTVNQITSVELRKALGTGTMGANTGFAVFGRNVS